MAGKQVTELDALPSFTDNSLLPVHNGAGLKKGLLSQLVSYLGNKFSNPNFLINPDFKINQRGATSYTSGYTVDRWKVINATLNATTKALSNASSENGAFLQSLENKPTGTFTVTLDVASVTGTVKFSWMDGSTYKTGVSISKGINTYTFTASNLTWVGIYIASGASVQLKYMKLEQGSVATHFVEPNLADELVKCKRFTQYYDSIPCIPGVLFNSNTTGATSGWLPLYQILSPSMRAVPTISVSSVSANNGSSISGNYSVNSDKNRLKSVVFKEANNYHTITLNKVLLDAEIY